MQKLAFFGTVFFIFIIFQAHAHDFSELNLTDILGQQTVNALLEAREQGYVVRALVKNVDGQVKVNVLLGEKHCFNLSSQTQAGKEIIHHFPLRGVEGYKSTSPITKAICCCLTPLTYCVRHFQNAKCGSLIAYTNDLEDENGRLLENALDKQLIWLEEDHKSDLAEDFSMIEIASLIIMPIGIGISYIAGYSPVSEGLIYSYLAIAGLFVSGYLAPLVEAYLPLSCPTNWLRWAGCYGLAAGRNNTIANASDSALEKDTKNNALLTIIGALHIVGVERLLRKKGYQLITF